MPEGSSANRIWLLEQSGNMVFITQRPNEWLLTQRLNEDMAVKARCRVRLDLILLPGREVLEDIAQSNDRRMLSDSVAFYSPRRSIALEAGLPLQPANPYLILLFLFVLFIERMIAIKRHQ